MLVMLQYMDSYIFHQSPRVLANSRVAASDARVAARIEQVVRCNTSMCMGCLTDRIWLPLNQE